MSFDCVKELSRGNVFPSIDKMNIYLNINVQSVIDHNFIKETSSLIIKIMRSSGLAIKVIKRVDSNIGIK